MKIYKFFIYLGIIFILLFILTGCSNQENEDFNDTSGTRTSAIINEEKNNTTTKPSTPPKPKEEEISSFSTEILDDSAGRLNNISITCSTINDTIIHNGETFSFNNIVGKPTTEKGYQEAKVIVNHHATNGIGGGNCQVSTTIYNAVLAVPNLTVVERNDHGGKDVGYIEVGKDAAVSYGSLDLKFRNDTGNDIKILATTDNQTITIKIIKITYE